MKYYSAHLMHLQYWHSAASSEILGFSLERVNPVFPLPLTFWLSVACSRSVCAVPGSLTR